MIKRNSFILNNGNAKTVPNFYASDYEWFIENPFLKKCMIFRHMCQRIGHLMTFSTRRTSLYFRGVQPSSARSTRVLWAEDSCPPAGGRLKVRGRSLFVCMIFGQSLGGYFTNTYLCWYKNKNYA